MMCASVYFANCGFSDVLRAGATATCYTLGSKANGVTVCGRWKAGTFWVVGCIRKSLERSNRDILSGSLGFASKDAS